MPRNLPWLLDTTASSKPSSSSSAIHSRASTPQPRRAGATSSSAAAAAASSTTRNNARKLTSSPPGSGGSRTRRRDFLRSSPTPPSSPIHRCPSEEYLIPGLQNDDIYMMVEDEFYSVAQSFTQHLHYAEYVRRKKEVKAQQRELLQQQQQRPTDGVTPLSGESKKRNAQEELAARQREGLATMTAGVRPVVSGDEEDGEEEEEEDETWAGTSLHELMVSPRKNRSLVGMQRIRSATRAAAGFAQAPGGIGRRFGAGIGGAGGGGDGGGGGSGHGRDDGHQVDDDEDATASEDEDDDLDAHAHAHVKTTPHQVSRRRQSRRSPPLPEEHNYATSSDASLKSSSYRTPTIEPKSKKAQSMNATTTTTYRTPTPTTIISKRRLIFDDWDQLPEPPPKSNIQVQSRLSSSSSSSEAPPPPQNPRGIDPKAKKKSRLNEVPTFLL
ncbi:hypothetical protein ASPACDRAFT_45926 [Aspergillus aculeatus ATCC 16872]|uniref:Uncharacterized protein n=1 Tax=Aspergillus aculeatus (strain ATCC 16872 / CBS 172.66 / WB 5094) TaxID=690307 RepID=A0A1L9WLN1_ASPA1|nr:uncharacterized protein ASPACDRAFT_45926 [Aspergillus aculeatus ATCC 16872]OJJ97072.1 hypothetical protein ASPACDRAFT_45926 [Aspergillus aculeatus ATCC 16872]